MELVADVVADISQGERTTGRVALVLHSGDAHPEVSIAASGDAEIEGASEPAEEGSQMPPDYYI